MITDEDKAALRLLVQYVSRAFYEPKFIVVMDQLARHEVLKDDDLAGRMGLQLKELNKLMAVLEGDRLVQVHRQNELKEGAQRSVGRQYFYVDFQRFCNVVKWRVSEMRRRIDTGLRNELDNKGYICPRCHKSFAPLEVDKLMDFERGAFICDVCHAELIDNDDAESVRGSQDRMQRFNYQMRFIREGLRKSEEMVLPAFDVVQFISKNLASDAASQKGSGEPGRGLKVAGSYGEKRKDEGVGIVISTDKDEETVRRERDAEAAAKRQQNAMPSWHLKSTITGDLTALGVKENALQVGSAVNGALVNGHEANGFDESLKGLGRVGGSLNLSAIQPSVDMAVEDVKPDVKQIHEVDYYDHYYASLANSAAPSAQNTPSADFAFTTDDFDEDRKPDVDYLDSLNEYRKRSRSREDEGDAERKIAKTANGVNGVVNGVNGHSGVNGSAMEPEGVSRIGDEEAIEDDPIMLGGCLCPLLFFNGEPIAFSHVTEEHQELMTPEEYTAYFDVYQARAS
ncbi:hypothetical protein HETIRDRAFT_126621 [Heterobasidion irregulare TC 32-1]|uniref:HTH TFE/IIEalpha-type domain-containing protein n=1 Tax=Heterobasidion irregulare (strain TC 32-1) TaxID=747525 RepID=W4JXW4_HETIT|nr:uncharacterized protein HETIRDRAFT_126621 [Heterobasidion irregulare TC 32-1]ETW77930.1 hypothetical protein HETIRDRAFT_126621 [Heterobasidion irregulare TC 32-1]